jgi:hypothetical protein
VARPGGPHHRFVIAVGVQPGGRTAGRLFA